jgi:hypothetical protein
MDRWHQFINDAGAFLDGWGQQAERLGWKTEELFGLHRGAHLLHYTFDEAAAVFTVKPLKDGFGRLDVSILSAPIAIGVDRSSCRQAR